MDKYKVLKENNLDLTVGEIYDEAIVDSLCSMDFDNYDDDSECEEMDCIDCLAKHKIVKLNKFEGDKHD